MKTITAYRSRAKECRSRAAAATHEADRNRFLDLAAGWDQLAGQRLMMIRQHPELAVGAEQDDELTRWAELVEVVKVAA